MRGRRCLAAATVLAALLATTALAADGGWRDLAHRVAAADRFAPLDVTAGAEPPGFAYPVARPARAVLGSTWYASSRDASPDFVHVYYVPAPDTDSTAEKLYAALTASGFIRIGPDTSFVRLGYSPPERFCPPDPDGFAIHVAIEPVGGVPALDVRFVRHGGSSMPCSLIPLDADEKDAKGRFPSLADFSGMTYEWRVLSFGVRGSYHTSATVRTALPAAEAVAKIAERFAASGWTPSPPSVSGDTIVQRFLRTGSSRSRWNTALLVLDRRGVGVYDVLLDYNDGVKAPGG